MMIRRLLLPLGGAVIAAVFACSTSGSGASSAACSSLLTCCSKVPMADQLNCIQIAGTNVDSSCNEELVALQGTGACSSTSSSIGTGPGAGSGCSGLAACCGAMSGAEAASCLTIVETGVAASCNAELETYEATGACKATTSSGTGPSEGAACSQLAVCCSNMTGAQATACDKVVATGSASTCSGQLEAYEASGACSSSGTGPGSSGTGPGNTSTTNQTGTGPGNTSTTNETTNQTTNQTTSTSTSDCTPHALPAGFTFRTISLATGSCTSADDEGISTCIAQGTSCSSYEGIAGCGTCAFTDFTSNTWGPYAFVTAAGAGAVSLPFINTSGCLQKLDPAGSAACANAINQAFECELAACLDYCPIASTTDSAGEAALLGTDTAEGCLGMADSSVCASYVSAEDSACASLFTDAGTSPGTKCDTLSNATDTGPYIAVFCGGEDAGI